MDLILTVGDKTGSGDTVVEGSSRTTAAGTSVTFLNASMSGCPIPGHGGGSISSSNSSGKTTVAGSPICINGAQADCGCPIAPSHTSRTYAG